MKFENFEYSLDDSLRATLSAAFAATKLGRHKTFTEAHLLLALLDNAISVNILRGGGFDLDRLGVDLKSHIDSLPAASSSDALREPQVSEECFGMIYRASLYKRVGTYRDQRRNPARRHFHGTRREELPAQSE